MPDATGRVQDGDGGCGTWTPETIALLNERLFRDAAVTRAELLEMLLA